MNISNARYTCGLSATGALSGTGVDGTVSLGITATPVRLTDCDTLYSVRCILAKSADELVIDLAEAVTTGSTSWVDGVAQVETATITAASGATSAGNMVLALTSAGMTGSPLNVTVALTTAMNTAALVAAAARAALEASAVVAARFTIGGTGANIVLTRKPLATYTEGDAPIPIYAATDATLNLAIPSGLGITAAATSADTTAGTETSGAKIFVTYPSVSGVGTVPLISTPFILLGNSLAGAAVPAENTDCKFEIEPTAPFMSGSSNLIASSVTFTATGLSDFSLTVIGTAV